MKKHLPLILTVIVIATFILQSDVVAQLEYEIIGIYVDSAWEKEGYLAAEPNMSMCHKVDLTEVVEFGGALHLFLNNGEFFYTPFPMVSVTDPNNNLGLGHLYMQELEQYKWYRAGIKDGVGGPAAIFASAVSGFGGNPSIFVCPPIWPEYPATATPTVSPAGCSFLALPNDGSTKAYTFSGDYRLHSHQGTALWARGGPDASNKDWTTLPSHPDSAAPVVPAGSYELFKAGETTPNADLLVCRVQATPTPTVTPTVLPDNPDVDYCPASARISLNGSDEYICELYPNDVVGADCGVTDDGHWVNLYYRRASETEWTPVDGSGICGETVTFRPNGERVYARYVNERRDGSLDISTWHYSDIHIDVMLPYSATIDLLKWQRAYYYLPDYPDSVVARCNQLHTGSWATFGSDTDRFINCVSSKTRMIPDLNDGPFFIETFNTAGEKQIQFTLSSGPTPTAPTATRTAVATPTGVPTPDWWPTNTPVPSETPTPTPTPTVTPTPTWDGSSLYCPAGDLYIVDGPTSVRMWDGGAFQVLDSSVVISDSYAPGVHIWGSASGSYVATPNAGVARLYVCPSTPTPTPTATGTPGVGAPTATPAGGYGCDICLALGQIVTNLEIQINLQQTAIALQQTPPPISVIVPTTDPRYEKTKIALLETIAAGPPTGTPGTPTHTPTDTRTPTYTPTGTLTDTPTPGTPTATGTPVSQAVFISIEQSAYSVREDAGSVEIVIIISRPLTQSISVSYSTTFGSAGAADFVSVSNSTTFAPGETRRTVQITIVDDTLDEPDEDFTFELSNPQIASNKPPGLAMPLLQSDPLVSLGSPASSSVTIVDDDWPTIPTFDAVCVLVPPTATTGTTPWPTFRPIPTMRALPALPGVTAVVVTASPGVTITVTSEAFAQWMAPAETMDAWSEQQFGEDAWATGQADGQVIADEIGSAVGWLSVLLILGPLAAWVPLIIIRLNVSLSARVVLVVVRVVRSMLWR
jgi:hypothetical protein